LSASKNVIWRRHLYEQCGYLIVPTAIPLLCLTAQCGELRSLRWRYESNSVTCRFTGCQDNRSRFRISKNSMYLDFPVHGEDANCHHKISRETPVSRPRSESKQTQLSTIWLKHVELNNHSDPQERLSADSGVPAAWVIHVDTVGLAKCGRIATAIAFRRSTRIVDPCDRTHG